MKFPENDIKHFNLYYIFEEDKRRHTLSKQSAINLWKNILLATKDVNRLYGTSPPTDN